MANWREPGKESPGKRYSAMGLGMILVFLAFWYLWGARLSGPKTEGGQVTDVSPETFREMAAEGKPGILEFYTNSCPWCAKIEPELAMVASAYGEKVFVAKMNAEKYYSEAAKYELSGVPTLVFFDSKGAATAIASGFRDFDDIVEILRDHKFLD